MKYKSQLNARISHKTYKDLKTTAKIEKLTFSDAVRETLELGLEAKKKKKTRKMAHAG